MTRPTPSLPLLLLISAAPGVAAAHPAGGPAVAWPLTPHSVGVLADQSYTFSWSDTNYLTPTGTISIDWFYTAAMPPTFQLGTTPPDLLGIPIVLGVDEQDRADAFTWDTSTVAPGSYWLWSRMTDLPGETSLRINAFSRGLVTVVHPGDVVHPAIAMTSPRSPFEVVEGDVYDVTYEAFDPDGTGRVTLEAMRQRDGSDALLIADDLPASRTATVSWRVADLPEGDWILRATLRDGRGLGCVAYGRFVLTIIETSVADAGPRPDAARDGGSEDIGTYDSGASIEPSGEGCGCAAAPSDSRRSNFLIIVVCFCWLGRRARSSSLGALDSPRSCS